VKYLTACCFYTITIIIVTNINRVLKGSEDIIVLQLLTKAMKFANENKSLKLKSVVASGVKGFIYVEAENEPDVR
jgi:Early transcription elongation factor of RNA pol II, NGN section